MFDIYRIPYETCTCDTTPHKYVVIRNIEIYIHDEYEITQYVIPLDEKVCGC